MTNKQKGLLPCPFCGGAGVFKPNSNLFARDKGKAFKVECENRKKPEICPVNMRTHYTDGPTAIKLWNTRA